MSTITSIRAVGMEIPFFHLKMLRRALPGLLLVLNFHCPVIGMGHCRDCCSEKGLAGVAEDIA